MQNAPDKIREAYEKIKKEYPFYIALKLINGKYYIYKQSSRRNPEGKTKVISEYIGRITEDGAIVKKAVSKETELSNAAAIIVAHGGKVVLPEKTENKMYSTANGLVIDKVDEKILTALSMNGRIEAPHMRKIMSIKHLDIRYRIEGLEKRFGIRYLAVIDPLDKIHYEEHVAFVKFKNRLPSSKEIKDILGRNPYVQLAVLTTGDYDLLIYFLPEKEYTSKRDTIYALECSFPGYETEWHVSLFYRSYGYIPLRDDFFEKVLVKKIWHKTKDNPRPLAAQMTFREYVVLRELCANGDRNLVAIDKKYRFDAGKSQYTYHKLKSSRIINRITITMSNLPVKYVAVFHIKVVDSGKFLGEGRVKLLRNIMEEKTGVTNTYALEGSIDTPHSIIFFAPIISDEQFDEIKGDLEGIDGTNLSINIGRNIILGSFCYRRYDNAHNPIAEILEEEYGIPHNKEKLDYETSIIHTKNAVDIRGLPL